MNIFKKNIQKMRKKLWEIIKIRGRQKKKKKKTFPSYTFLRNIATRT